MNRWAALLAQTPPTLQRLIASSQRISLPRCCAPAERLARLRGALCRAAAVRAVYFTLDPEAQQALQELRHIPRGLSAPALAARFGTIRTLEALRVDRAPRSLSERLLLLGWLLPRPATRNHPARYMLPPELRAWLPAPLPGCSVQPQPGANGQALASAPAVRGATALLVAAATAPLPLRSDGGLAAMALLALRPRLAPLSDAESDALCTWLMPLLAQLGLLAPHGAAAVPGPAAPRFLAAPPDARVRALNAAWERCPRPDRWLTRLRVNTRGLDWPALRRRLRVWAAALPPDAPVDPAASYTLLSAALGPLADTGTHGVCASPRRAPWLPHRAADVWAAACAGPLVWLAELPPARSAASAIERSEHTAVAPGSPTAEQIAWAATADGCLLVRRGTHDDDLLLLAPFARFVTSDAGSDRFELSLTSVAAAAACGHDPSRLRALLLRRCGTLPAELEAVLAPRGGLRMSAGTLLLSDSPADLAAAMRRRSVRRAVDAQLAPGVALVAPGRALALARALARDGRIVAPPLAPDTAPPGELSPGEASALLVAAAFYQAHAPAGSPLVPDHALLERLRAGLPPALAAAADSAIAALRAVAQTPAADTASGTGEGAHATSQPPTNAPPSIDVLIGQLRTTLRRRGAVTLWYQGEHEEAPRERVVRPLRMEHHGPWWYLHAYCLLARDERCFRLDRVLAIRPTARQAEAASGGGERSQITQVGSRKQTGPRRYRSALRAGFFAGHPDAASGSSLVRVWLDEGLDQPMSRLDGDRPNAEDRDTLNRREVEPVAAHAVALGVDDGAQLRADSDELRPAELALKNAALHP